MGKITMIKCPWQLRDFFCGFVIAEKSLEMIMAPGAENL